MKKRKLKKKVLIFSKIILTIVIITVSLLLILKINQNKNYFIGTWVSEGGTIYEFKEKKDGVMKTSLSEYKFIYQIKDNILSIDFEDEKAIDTDYEYSCKKNTCTFISDRGTFIFTKN